MEKGGHLSSKTKCSGTNHEVLYKVIAYETQSFSYLINITLTHIVADFRMTYYNCQHSPIIIADLEKGT